MIEVAFSGSRSLFALLSYWGYTVSKDERLSLIHFPSHHFFEELGSLSSRNQSIPWPCVSR